MANEDPLPLLRIAGGEPAEWTPWLIQLWKRDEFWCTANLISPRWALTARHAVEGMQDQPAQFKLFIANDYPPGKDAPTFTPTRIATSPDGDMALLELEHSLFLPGREYAPLAESFTADPGGIGTIFGFGFGANGSQPQSLRKASVRVTGENPLGKDGPTVIVRGITGASMPGDSGGPLIVQDKLVGTLSTGTSQGEIDADSYYANITASRKWIRAVAGV